VAAEVRQIDPHSKDPGLLRARKDLERKRPSRRKTEQYWSEGQFRQLIAAGPGRLASRSMIPYQVLILPAYSRRRASHDVRTFLASGSNTPDRVEGFQKQLDSMIGNLAAFGYLTRAEDGDHVTLDGSIHRLLLYRSVDPLYGAYLAEKLTRSNFDEKVMALESVLPVPPVIERHVRIPDDLRRGRLQTNELQPALIAMGAVLAKGGCSIAGASNEEYEGLLGGARRGAPTHVSGDAGPGVSEPARGPGPVLRATQMGGGLAFQLDLRLLQARGGPRSREAGRADSAAPAAPRHSRGRVFCPDGRSRLSDHRREGDAHLPRRRSALHGRFLAEAEAATKIVPPA